MKKILQGNLVMVNGITSHLLTMLGLPIVVAKLKNWQQPLPVTASVAPVSLVPPPNLERSDGLWEHFREQLNGLSNEQTLALHGATVKYCWVLTSPYASDGDKKHALEIFLADERAIVEKIGMKRTAEHSSTAIEQMMVDDRNKKYLYDYEYNREMQQDESEAAAEQHRGNNSSFTPRQPNARPYTSI
jgi:hypothetical protein